MKKLSKVELLRFPLLFGAILSVLGIGFVCRENWMGNIEVEKTKLYKQNVEGDSILEELKRQHKQK